MKMLFILLFIAIPLITIFVVIKVNKSCNNKNRQKKIFDDIDFEEDEYL